MRRNHISDKPEMTLTPPRSRHHKSKEPDIGNNTSSPSSTTTHYPEEFLPSPEFTPNVYQTKSRISKPSGTHLASTRRKKIKSVLERLNESSDWSDIAIVPSVQAPPSTPSRQLITDDDVEFWHGKSRNIYSDEEEEEEDDDADEGVGMRSRLENPFLTPPISRRSGGVVSREEDGIDRSTHIEYINHTTGKRTIKKMTASQMKIQPKRLNFDAFKQDEPKRLNFDTFKHDDINSRYVGRNLHNLVNVKSKSGLDFHIFNDDEKSDSI
ncbi:uncharacterized protein J8A68_001949 [[Candida] subhashii]|uniref:Uncharacterized protein n=1 Tax=[Candida] subhashii TaxID=561895 RepID=A0A8J5QQB9_9ASCO|nr:uncharacterized protein J8A68_001949 [[Candida] subhashii]KAG7664523.1 hypothetical protein J8A68_001949 [[Candida] subhashii]